MLLLTSAAHAQLPVFTGLELFSGGSSMATPLAEINGKLILSSYEAIYGNEPYVSDGTVAGTTLLKDIKPGTGNGFNYFGGAVYNGKYYFTANDGTNGTEIWYTDGTTNGTQLLKDINPGAASAFNQTNFMTVSAGKLYFAADNGVNGYEVWVSDGTNAGTTMLKDIQPGGVGCDPQLFTELNGKTLFSATTATYGQELWITDGTSAGTQLIQDINTGAANAGIANLIKFNNEIFFFARSVVDGYEVWHTDGTGAGTLILKDINPSGDGVDYGNFAILGNKLFFPAKNGVNGEELWSSDGTAAGTQLFKDAFPGSDGMLIRNLTVCNGKLYFRGIHAATTGAEPWVSDGTVAGTFMLKDLNPGTGHGFANLPKFTAYKKYTYFTGAQTTGDIQLWQTDGTTANTKLISPPTAPITNPLNLTAQFLLYTKDSSLYFTAGYDATGAELWKITDTTSYPNSVTTTAHNTADVRIYPNPAHHNFTINITQSFKSGSITLTDVTGRIVKSENLNTKSEIISLEGIAPGIYIADIWLDDKRSTQKIVIE